MLGPSAHARRRTPRGRFVWARAVTATAAAIAAAVALGAGGNQPVRADSVGARMVEPNANFRSWKFEPATITAAVGDAVVFTNGGGAAHTVTEKDKKFDSGNLDPGQTFTWKPTSGGTFTFFCTYHPWMTGTITVSGPANLPAAATHSERDISLAAVAGALLLSGAAAAPAGVGVLLVGWLIADARRHAA